MKVMVDCITNNSSSSFLFDKKLKEIQIYKNHMHEDLFMRHYIFEMLGNESKIL